MNPVIGQAVLGVYAILLAAGGVMGYVKAKSRPSLIAGIASGVLAAVAAVLIGFHPRAGCLAGLVVAIAMTIVFAARYLKTKKLTPAVPILALSLIVAATMLAFLS